MKVRIVAVPHWTLKPQIREVWLGLELACSIPRKDAWDFIVSAGSLCLPNGSGQFKGALNDFIFVLWEDAICALDQHKPDIADKIREIDSSYMFAYVAFPRSVTRVIVR